MKKTFYMLWVLLLCIPAVSVRAEKSTVWNYTRLYRQTLLDTNSICGVIFLGYIDGSANDRDCLKQVLYDEGNMNEFPFLSDIPDEHIVEIEYGSELYCIFPF